MPKSSNPKTLQKSNIHLWAGTLLALLAVICYTATYFSFGHNRISRIYDEVMMEYYLTIIFFLIMALIVQVATRGYRGSLRIIQDIEEKYATLVQEAADPIVVLNAIGTIVTINTAVEKVIGYTAEELVGKHFLTINVLMGQSMSVASREFLFLIRGETRPPFELKIMHKDGYTLTFEANARRIISAEGSSFIQIIFRDVTTRKHAEETLMFEKNKAQNYLNIAGVMILAIDRNEKVSLINRMGCEILGYKEDEIIGANWFDQFLPTYLRESERDYFRKIISGKKNILTHTETLIITKSKEERLIAWNSSFLHDENGEIIGTLNSGQDITEKRKIEERLHLQSAALESASNGIVITDRNGKIVWANSAITALSGHAKEEVVGNNPRLQKSGLHNANFYENMWNTILSGNIWHGEIINRRKDDRLYTEEMTITPVRNKEGEIRHFIAIKQDITERKRLHQAMEQANIELEANSHKLEKMLVEMEEKNKELKDTQNQLLQTEKLAAIGVLSSGIAHEIKNPLAIISLSIEELQSAAKSFDPASQRHIEMIRKAADRANNVIIELLRFARVSDLTLDRINLFDLIEGTFVLVLNSTKFKGATLTHLPADKSIEIMGDRILLEQAIFNLLMNAIDAIERQGVITVKSYSRKAYSTNENAKEVIIEISDTGQGIDPEVLPRIFEPFFTTKEQGKGTGLGLSTVYTILRRHEGTIFVDSTIGKGTTFTLTLPMAG